VNRGQGRYTLKETVLAALFLSPAMAIFVAFAYGPFVRLIEWGTYRSVRNGASYEQVGVQQYVDVFGSDDFWSGIWHSTQFVLFTVPTGLVLGTLLAVAAERRLRGIAFFQTVFASTIATGGAVSVVIFYFLLNPVIGVFKVGWLNDPDMAMFAVTLPSIWQSTGGSFIIVLAGLQAIPQEVVEASMLDGYGPVRRLFRIVLPLISPVLLFLTVALVITALQAYAEVDVLTQGRPDEATETLLYKIAAADQPATQMRGAVMSVGLFVMTALVVALQFRMLSKRVHYGN
jgi:sn-glycerol 3-phosphate transport system permease protein